MRRKLKLVFRALLSLIGIYQGLQMMLMLWVLANQLPEIVSILRGTPIISSSLDPNLYFFSLTQTVLLITFNVLCIVASQKRLQWRWLLSCGIVGIAGHLVTIMYGIYLQTFTAQYMLYPLPFFVRPSLILVVALYERTHPDNDLYQPISTAMRIRRPAGGAQRIIQSEKWRKRCTKLVLFLMLSVMLMITVVTFANLWAMEAPERELGRCNQIINKRCGVLFDVASLELGDNNDWGFQDVGYEFKCGLNNSAELLEAELLAKGWHCERFPALMVQEILSNTAFRVEMDQMNSDYKSYWLYVDIDYQRNGHKSTLLRNAVYNTPHYQLALYVPEINTLYYLEYSI